MKNLKRGGVCDIIKPKAPERIKQGEKDRVPGKSGRSAGRIFPARQSGVGSFPREARSDAICKKRSRFQPRERRAFSFAKTLEEVWAQGSSPKAKAF
jgi:hypothetical protein